MAERRKWAPVASGADASIPQVSQGAVAEFVTGLVLPDGVTSSFPVGQHPLCLRRAAYYGSDSGAIADGARDDEDADWAAQSIGYGLKFCVMLPFPRPNSLSVGLSGACASALEYKALACSHQA